MRHPLVLAILVMIGLAAPAFASGSAHGGGSSASKDAKKPPVHKITQSESYVMVDPIYTTIMERDRPVGLLMIGIGLDVPDSALRERVEHDMPMLRDAFVRSLMSYSSISVRSWRQPDVTAISDRLQHVADRMLGRKGARLLLAQVAMRLKK